MNNLLETGLCNAAMATVLAVLAAGLCRIWRRPAFAHAVWLIVLLKLLTPPLVPVPLPWFGDAGAPSATESVQEIDPAAVPQDIVQDMVPEPGVVRAGDDIQPALTGIDAPERAGDSKGAGQVDTGLIPASWVGSLFGIWLAGSVLCLGWIAASTYRFKKLLRFAHEAGPEVQALATELAARLTPRRPPRVSLVPGAVSPMLWALGGPPLLLFPAGLLERLDGQQLRTLIAHELAHWHRRDHWVRFVELAVQVIYWWHPAVWWIRGELREAEEQCCDAWVLAAVNGAERTYALALLETAAFVSHTRPILPATASGIGQVPHLRRRLTMIMSGQTPRTLNGSAFLGLAVFGLALLPLVPARAQDRERSTAEPVQEQKVQLDAAGAGLERQLQELTASLQIAQAQPKNTSVDEQIEALRRVLQLLEEQRRKEKGGAAANPEEVKKARDEVAKLSQVAQEKRAALTRAEIELQKAQARLAKLEGRTTMRVRVLNELRQGAPIELRVEGIRTDGPARERVRTVVVQPQTGDPARERVRSIVVQPKLVDVVGVVRPAPDDLRQRIDRLLREVEELRREVQRGQPGSRRVIIDPINEKAK
jgi:bla regulator protein BlaR1